MPSAGKLAGARLFAECHSIEGLLACPWSWQLWVSSMYFPKYGLREHLHQKIALTGLAGRRWLNNLDLNELRAAVTVHSVYSISMALSGCRVPFTDLRYMHFFAPFFTFIAHSYCACMSLISHINSRSTHPPALPGPCKAVSNCANFSQARDVCIVHAQL